MHISVIGCGQVGLVTGACLAAVGHESAHAASPHRPRQARYPLSHLRKPSCEGKCYFFTPEARVITWMMRHRGVPSAPERLHIVGEAERYANVLFEGGISGADEHASGAEHVHYFLAGRRSPQQDKIGLRIQAAQHARIHLIEEFLAIVLVELGNFLHVSRIGERGKRHARRNDTHIDGKAAGRLGAWLFPSRKSHSPREAPQGHKSWKMFA